MIRSRSSSCAAWPNELIFRASRGGPITGRVQHYYWHPIRCASEVHHVTPLAEGGTDAPSNLRSLCGDCHTQQH